MCMNTNCGCYTSEEHVELGEEAVNSTVNSCEENNG